MKRFQEASIDQVKSFWNRRPCNIRHSPREVGTKTYFDEVEARKYFVEPHIPRFAEFERWNGRKVLEIGCGIGTETINFARHGARVTAVELSDKSLEIAIQRAKIYGLEDSIRFYQGDAEQLKQFLPVESYDLIWSFGVIHHSPHPHRIVQQIRSYVHPNSTIKIMVYRRYSWKGFGILLTHSKARWWRWDESIARYSEAQTGCPITYTFTRSQARNLLEQSGFRVTEMFVDHIFPYRIKDYIEYKYVKQWYIKLIPKGLFRWAKKWGGWHLCITAQPQAVLLPDGVFHNPSSQASC